MVLLVLSRSPPPSMTAASEGRLASSAQGAPGYLQKYPGRAADLHHSAPDPERMWVPKRTVQPAVGPWDAAPGPRVQHAAWNSASYFQ